MEKVLIAGGAGFIGSNVADYILNEGSNVVVIDNLSTGSMKNVERFLDDSNYKFIKLDICDKVLFDVLRDESFDVIYNFACPANPPYCFSHSLEIIKTNVYGVFNLADLAIKNNAILFQSSTSEVYGNPECSPQSEDYFGNVNPCGIRACYDEGKRCAEAICYDYHRYYNLDVRVARIFNTYGPGMNLSDGRVIVQFLLNALQNKPLVINGNGMQTRSFCYISDLVTGIVNLVRLPQMPKGPVNLGNDCEKTILETAEIICNLTRTTSSICYAMATPDDPVRRKPDIRYARQLLEWKPTITLEEGLVLTIPYFEKLIEQKR